MLGRFIVEQLGYGALVGVGIGLAGGLLLGLAHRKKWMAESLQQLGVIALPLLCLLASEAVGASMFIAAFVAGLAVQVGFKEAGRHSVEFAEEWGQLLNLAGVFSLRPAGGPRWRQFTPAALLLCRAEPHRGAHAAGLAGACGHAALHGQPCCSWAGSARAGLASIVLGLVYLEQELHNPGEATIRIAVMATVLLSIFAHGLSAMPGINLYAAKIAALPPAAPEHQEM